MEHNEIKDVENCWRESGWFHVLRLPTWPWVRPFLQDCELPTPLLECLPYWGQIVEQTEREFCFHSGEFSKKGIEIDPQLRQYHVSQALQQLADIIGISAAREFEHWCRLHFFLNEGSFGFTLGVWWDVLRRAWIHVRPEALAQLKPGRRSRQVPPPDVLVPLLSEIALWIDLNRVHDLHASIEAAAPLEANPGWNVRFLQECQAKEDQKRLAKASLEQRQQIKAEIRNRPPIPDYILPHSSYLLKSVIKQNLWFKALQIMARGLSPIAIAEVVDWAERQVIKSYTYSADLAEIAERDKRALRGSSYISKTLPDFDGISVFDLPASINELPFQN